MKKLLTLSFLLLSYGGFAQTYRVSGILIDSTDQNTVIGAVVQMVNKADTSVKYFDTSNENGVFNIRVPLGEYGLRVISLAHVDFAIDVKMEGKAVNIGKIVLSPGDKILGKVTVEEDVEPIVQRGDTISYDADAFKTNPDATAGDLIKKMPGITNDDGSVQAQGETVTRVLVDGKEFFGDDPKTALDNLPAEAVKKVEVYDEPSDQAQETGFDDGQRIKTINIITREDKRSGQFGRFYAGVGWDGLDDRYASGGNVNYFSDKRRVSIIGLANNINEQNFSTQDLLSATGSNNSRRGGRRGGGGGMGDMMMGGGADFGNPLGNFLVGQQGGITETASIGINYSDTWLDKIDVSSSYFFNTSDNRYNADNQSQYFLRDASSYYYVQGDTAQSRNFNHRLNTRMTYRPDKKNTVIFRGSFNTQQNSQDSRVLGENFPDEVALDNDQAASSTDNLIDNQNNGYFLNSSLLYAHRFEKRKRSFSAFFNANVNNSLGDGYLGATSTFSSDGNTVNNLTNQFTDSQNEGYQVLGNLSYTEPIGGKSQLQVAYALGYSQNFSERLVLQRDPVEQSFSLLDSSLSNKLDNDYLTHTVGVGYNWRQGQKTILVFGVNYEVAELAGQQTFPSETNISRSFNNLLPTVFFRYEPSKNSRLFAVYRASTNAPSVTQLQDVVNNTNPLQLSTGNTGLQQEFNHFFITRFSATKLKTSENFFVFALVNATDRKISTETYYADSDTVSIYDVEIAPSAQLSRPVNLNGFVNARLYFGYGRPIKAIKTNVNFNFGVNYTRSPGILNEQLNISDNYTITPRISFSSNISENVDFTVGTRSNFSIVSNTLQPELNNNFFSQVNDATLTLIRGRFVFRSQAQHYWFTGLEEEFNQNYMILNGSIGMKLFHGKLGEISLSVFDLLKQNNSITRSVQDTYIEDNRTTVLTRYVMLNFAYRIRNFGA